MNFWNSLNSINLATVLCCIITILGLSLWFKKIVLNRLNLPIHHSFQISFGLMFLAILYYLSFHFHVEVVQVQSVFVAIFITGAMISLCALCFFKPQSFNLQWLKQHSWILSSLTLIGLMTYAIGPYLEFPTDPLMHLNFIGHWHTLIMMENSHLTKYVEHFNYFLYAIFTNNLHAFEAKLHDINLLSTVLVMGGFWLHYNVCRLLRLNAMQSCLGSFLSVLFMGDNFFSYYRYYILSSNYFSFLILLDAVIPCLLLFLRTGRLSYLFLSLPFILLCGIIHAQYFYFLLNILGPLLIFIAYRKSQRTIHLQWQLNLIFIFLISIVCWSLLNYHGFQLGLITQQAMGISVISGRTVLGYQLQFGSLYLIQSVYGVWGGISFILASFYLIFLRRNRLLNYFSLLTIVPVILLCFPFTLHILLKFMPADILFRLLYSSFFWLYPLLFVLDSEVGYFIRVRINKFLKNVQYSTLEGKYLRITRAEYLRLMMLLLITLALIFSGRADANFYGRLFHLTNRPAAELSGGQISPVIDWITEYSNQNCLNQVDFPNQYPVKSFVLADTYLNSYLSTTGLYRTVTGRREEVTGYNTGKLGFHIPMDLSYSMVADKGHYGNVSLDTLSIFEFMQILQRNQNCLIVYNRVKQTPASEMAKISGHWRPDQANMQRFYQNKSMFWFNQENDYFVKLAEIDGYEIYRVNRIYEKISINPFQAIGVF